MCVYHSIGLKTGFISVLRVSRKLRMCVVYVHVCVYVLVRKRTFDWLNGLKLSSFDSFTFSRACIFYYLDFEFSDTNISKKKLFTKT